MKGEELRKLKLVKLRAIGKELKIKKLYSMNKANMIHAILNLDVEEKERLVQKALDERPKSGIACIHGEEKNFCPVCKSKSMCRHGKLKRLCKECDGRSFCPHGKADRNCMVCFACKHGNNKYFCAVCTERRRRKCPHEGKRELTCKKCAILKFCEEYEDYLIKNGRDGEEARYLRDFVKLSLIMVC